MTTGFGKLGAGAGILFAVLFVVAVVSGPGNLPSGSDAQVVAFYADSGNRMGAIVSAYLFAAAALCYTIFLIDIRARFQRSTVDAAANWSGVSVITGALFLALMVAAGAAVATIAGDINFGDDPNPVVPDVARFLPELVYALLLVGGMVLAAGHLASTSMAALRSRVLPRWLCIAGLIGSVILLASVLFIPMVVLPLWVLAASIVFLTRAESAGG
jgi:hypothetical protein